MNFDEAVKYLYELGNEVAAMKLGLENIGIVLDALGSPQKNFLKVQIAGTNGKGSTCAFLDAICVSAGIKTGLFTSPHLISVTERVKVNGTEISETDFARKATKVRAVSEELVRSGQLETVPTYFEQVTAIALSAFAEAKIELAILETGLGGRFDATTAANAEIAAITPIDYDHQNILGDTLAKIAAEKAAIIRQQTRKVISAPQRDTEIVRIIETEALNHNLETIWANPVTEFKKPTKESDNIVTITTAADKHADVNLSLMGQHQAVNSALAVTIAENLREYFQISKQHIIHGLENATHRGRLEFYKSILFDGAHNVAGAKALRQFLKERIKQPITMIFGAMRDKDITEIAEILFPQADKLILTKPDNPRSMNASELEKFVPGDFNQDSIFQTETVEEALEIAKRISSGKDLICVTGSLYLVGEAQGILRREF